MKENESTLEQKIKTLEEVCRTAMQLSGETQGRKVAEWRLQEGSLVFARIAVSCASFLRLIPTSTFFTPVHGFLIWDLSSAAALARSIVEAYYSFFYIAVENAAPEEQKCRKILWHYHAAWERHEMMKAPLPESKHLPDLAKRVTERRAELERCPVFASFSDGRKRQLIDGREFMLKSKVDLSAVAGIAPRYYRGQYKYCSAFAHTAPFSLEQLDRFRAGDDESKQVLGTIVALVTGYVCVAIRDFVKLFPDQERLVGAEVRDQIELWVGIFKWDVPMTEGS